MTNASPEDHERFLADLEKSDQAVWLIAKWIHDRGNNVKVNVAPKADKPDNWKNYADHGDLELCYRIEVKGLNYDFTGRADWPHLAYIVCSKHSFDRAVPKPYAYIHVNPAGTHAGVVMAATAKHWSVKEIKDSRYNRVQACYLCPLEHVKWLTL